MINSRVEIDLRTLDHVDLDQLSSKMDGFVAADLVTVTERAVHAGSSREIAQGLRPPAQDGSGKDCNFVVHITMGPETPTLKPTAHCTISLPTPTNWGSAVKHANFCPQAFCSYAYTLPNSDPQLIGVGSTNRTVCGGL